MSQLWKRICGSIILCGVVFFHSAVKSQTQGSKESVNIISNSSLSNTTGNLSVNTSAGIGNQQANISVISVSNKLASALISSHQNQVEINYTSADTTGGIDSGALSNKKQAEIDYASADTKSSIDSGALSNVSGIVAVNQVSGNNNIQANLLAIAVGGTAEVSIEQLGRIGNSEKRSGTAENESDIHKINQATIADSALSNTTGIVQINQIAGSGNITANIFTLAVGTMRP